MQISRSDIRSDILVEYPLAERFIKIPIQNYLEEEGIAPNAPQIALLNAINDPRYRFITGCLGRRVGKSYVSFNVAFLKALEPNTKVLIIAPDFSLANVGLSIMSDLIKKHGLETEKFNLKDREIMLANGSLIKVGSVGRVDSCVGRSYDLIVFDECALHPKGGEAFSQALRPTLDKPQSKAVFISTPRGLNWYHDFYQRGFSDESAHTSWMSVHATVYDNPRASESDIAEAKANNTKNVFEQEYLAAFTAFEGQVFGFNTDEHVLSEEDEHTFLQNIGIDDEFILGIDVGYRDPTAMVAVHFNDETEVYTIVDEYEKNEATTNLHAAHIQRFVENYDPFLIFIDAAAAQFRADLAVDYDISSSPAKKSVLDGIAFVDTLLAQGKLKVLPSCRKTIDGLINYRWDIESNSAKEKPIHDHTSHMMDAVRYALYSHNR